MDFIIDSSMVQSLLLVVIFLSILVEIKTGGTGVGALLGLIAAAVFWGSSYVKGLVSLYQIAIFIVGVNFYNHRDFDTNCRAFSWYRCRSYLL